MFNDDDFGLPELRATALDFPQAFEKVSWGRPVFCAPKIFVMYGGNERRDGPMSGSREEQKAQMVPFPYSMLVKVDESDGEALRQDGRFYYPAYMGPSGWLGLDFTAADVDWDEVRELVDASFRLVAPKKLIKELDER
jgi:predicted DNA-binding protein (MmcQ/YjbR family)